MADISKITLPSGNTYDIKDATARSMIAGGVSFNIVWTSTNYTSSTAPTAAKLAEIPEGVIVYYNSGAASATGTLEASTTTKGKFYLIYSKTQSGNLDMFDEYATIESGSSLFWEKIGDTLIDLSNVVTNVELNKQTDVVLGESTTFTNASSTVSFSGGTTDVVLGADTTFALTSGAVTHGALTNHTDEVLGSGTTFTVTQPTITVTPTTATIKATASNGQSVSCEITVKDKEAEVNKVILNKSTVQLKRGEEFTLTATVIPDTVKDKTITWTSSNTSVAEIVDGKITAKDVGTSIITATSVNNRKALCIVNVYILKFIYFINFPNWMLILVYFFSYIK